MRISPSPLDFSSFNLSRFNLFNSSPPTANISRLEGSMWYAHELMKKTFPLHVPGKEDRRVVETIKLELTKYVKRERRKTLPQGVDFWDFNCKVGVDSATASTTPLPDVANTVEAVALLKGTEVYVEIMATPGYRVKKTSPTTYHRLES